MASGGARADIDATHNLFIGEDRTIAIDVNQSDGTTAQTMTGWTLVWELLDGDPTQEGATVLVTKTPSIGNGDGTNDRASVTLADTDTEALAGPGKYWHILRRSDAGSETVLAWGEVVIFRGSI